MRTLVIGDVHGNAVLSLTALVSMTLVPKCVRWCRRTASDATPR